VHSQSAGHGASCVDRPNTTPCRSEPFYGRLGATDDARETKKEAEGIALDSLASISEGSLK
jgi:hypothetical protein